MRSATEPSRLFQRVEISRSTLNQLGSVSVGYAHSLWVNIPKLGFIIPNMGMQKRTTKKAIPVRPTGVADVLFTKVQQRVLGVLFGNPGRSFSGVAAYPEVWDRKSGGCWPSVTTFVILASMRAT